MSTFQHCLPIRMKSSMYILWKWTTSGLTTSINLDSATLDSPTKSILCKFLFMSFDVLALYTDTSAPSRSWACDNMLTDVAGPMCLSSSIQATCNIRIRETSTSLIIDMTSAFDGKASTCNSAPCNSPPCYVYQNVGSEAKPDKRSNYGDKLAASIHQ